MISLGKKHSLIFNLSYCAFIFLFFSHFRDDVTYCTIRRFLFFIFYTFGIFGYFALFWVVPKGNFDAIQTEKENSSIWWNVKKGKGKGEKNISSSTFNFLNKHLENHNATANVKSAINIEYENPIVI